LASRRRRVTDRRPLLVERTRPLLIVAAHRFGLHGASRCASVRRQPYGPGWKPAVSGGRGQTRWRADIRSTRTRLRQLVANFAARRTCAMTFIAVPRGLPHPIRCRPRAKRRRPARVCGCPPRCRAQESSPLRPEQASAIEQPWQRAITHWRTAPTAHRSQSTSDVAVSQWS
jgi:hypothetical protein